MTMPRHSARFNAPRFNVSTDKYPFLRKLRLCHDSLLTIAVCKWLI
ncbi:hypothetical protein XNC1_4275 [Xenorhabdus nematophila ATCC 19061]|uniref:Uncharacterized protein n=1 Tax=Xenorhabdus nematophila (strain ATCC 19061 / DSM 3370 / CCUG 14189 / LMG 1036 / NCIMB 9965 / AN6) TaxID=406817 RepID=D3VE46_XENNA|nr:hypothetical protein XNC1_4275 [Xenorhabdus nematophila ATCC 19061]CEE90838.1 hypothetical protein XNA1_1730001 [Xenorhabdus nematophila str. Anatoliense]CEF29013.1 hypothetical protein XNW1_1520001 [Xenorhabdus nematophila str. Websteri]CEK25112.1 hypothetical protein XNC2_4125 [Xenorhabdus nematophila AN6/1]CEE92520.1 hypothetical protein XNA1_2950001 [Xenorhabdus nematophila str. Anatoliense]